ncbi:MAG TPA: hypothetical protein VNW92_11590 [Polyangiaceae bacterium]|nr:hypothetical protein [Polyangiaceae bacterium]
MSERRRYQSIKHLRKALAPAVAASLLLVHGAFGQEVDDETRAAARKLANAGVAAYQAQHYDEASTKLEKAFHLLELPSVGLWSARALVKTGHLVEAQERYLRVARLSPSGVAPEVQKKAQADASADLAVLAPRVPEVVVAIDQAPAGDVSLAIDGKQLPALLVNESCPINPGVHKVSATYKGRSSEAVVEIAEGEHRRVSLHLDQSGSSGASPAQGSSESASGDRSPEAQRASANRNSGSAQRTIAWATVAVGGAGIALGAVTGALALARRSDLDGSGQCAASQCSASEQSTVSSYNSLRTLSGVGFIAGGLVAGAGVVVLLTSPHAEAPGNASLWVAPGSAGIRGRF